jgi:serine phosphatase RsbU (regulator of sigma subunit)
MLRQNAGRRFVTAVLARLELWPGRGARLVVASGGHPPPLLLRSDGTTEVVRCTGTLLGVEADATSTDHEVEMAPGDTLVLYTDGVTEARRHQPLTPEALALALADAAAAGPAVLASEIMRLAEDAAAGPLRDDVAALVLTLDPAG